MQTAQSSVMSDTMSTDEAPRSVASDGSTSTFLNLRRRINKEFTVKPDLLLKACDPDDPKKAFASFKEAYDAAAKHSQEARQILSTVTPQLKAFEVLQLHHQASQLQNRVAVMNVNIKLAEHSSMMVALMQKNLHMNMEGMSNIPPTANALSSASSSSSSPSTSAKNKTCMIPSRTLACETYPMTHSKLGGLCSGSWIRLARKSPVTL
eukprot:TRINITY_DN12627_c1_g1_i1.p1 TRINITY_DN12627_c1_g1~~TRINITY_DN12627_c1_g1_i1.p1  ORF type:complete len:208 (+),score=23.68 TRINITY_DN12627_c1_g1_i1:144-767(+)